MRTVCVLVLLGVLAVPVAVQCSVAPPRVWVVSSTQTRLVVRGGGFASGERLLVRLAGVGVTSRHLAADHAGSFRISLAKPEPQACGRYFLSVRRASGTSIRLRLGPLECADLGVSGAAAIEGAVPIPQLRTATASLGHIAVTFSVGDLLPRLIVVGTGVKRGSPGVPLVTHVVLRERVSTKPDPATALVSWRTRKVLPRGVYRVQVSGLVSDGLTSCFPQGRDCSQRWSNVRRVVVS